MTDRPLRLGDDGELARAEALATFTAHLEAVDALIAAARHALAVGLKRPDVEAAVDLALRDAGT